MTKLEELVANCIEALRENEPRLAVRDVLARAMTDRKLGAELDGKPGGLHPLHNDADVTVMHVVWPPGFTVTPHDHRMWAVNAIYAGRENNTLYRRQGTTIVESGGKEIGEGEVLVLGNDAIHAVHNPAGSHTTGIHVYGGDFFGTPRSQWDPATMQEEPWDVEEVRRAFAEANRAGDAAAPGRP
jgi:predicted metal-dependent enzyme (double-stranded beta helix superfamily)